jgi:nicotinamide mononucleotide adenylyltransferase
MDQTNGYARNGVTQSPPPVANPLDNYSFPQYRLQQTMKDSSKTPLLLVACGSFSPITYLHLRMFEMARDYIRFNTEYEIVGGYLSPVSDAYKKAGLASAEHRYITFLSGRFTWLWRLVSSVFSETCSQC